MPKRSVNGSNYRLQRRYRKGRLLWIGDVYWSPDWVAANLDGRRPIVVAAGLRSFTERGIRRRIAKRLRGEAESQGRNLSWSFKGRAAGEGDTRP